GIPLYLTLVQHTDPRISMVAAFVLASFREHAADLTPRLRALVGAVATPSAQASLLLSVGALAEPRAENLTFLEGIVTTSGGSLIGLAAALAQAGLAKGSVQRRLRGRALTIGLTACRLCEVLAMLGPQANSFTLRGL